ncbi:MAG: PaaI family thioesterase [Bacteroidetes bacterium]|nr:PaaI family thioesterase [Bacteroidota bacterium]MCL5025120.1 PaaI family thioesterase [Chloroflexota bacterium]
MREEQREACLKAARASSYWHLLGIELADLEDGFARLRLPVRAELQQGYGALHGGAITSLADSALAVALISLVEPDQRVSTVEIKVNFLRAVRAGQLVAEAHIVHKGRRLALGEVDVRNKEGELVAKGLATFAISR